MTSPRPLRFWGFLVYGRIEYRQNLGTVVVFDASPTKSYSAKALFDVCYEFQKHRLQMSSPDWDESDRLRYVLELAETEVPDLKPVSLAKLLDYLVQQQPQDTVITVTLLWLLHLLWDIPCSELLWTLIDRMLFAKPCTGLVKPHIRPCLNV